MLDPESPDMIRAVFGRQVEMFLESDVGQYLTQCAETEVVEALTKLKDADAEDPKAIRELQFKIRVAEAVVGWLNDAINAGQQARAMLETQ
jgi:phytoene/squalene synthetase